MASWRVKCWYMIILFVFISNLCFFYMLTRRPNPSDDPVVVSRLIAQLDSLQRNLGKQVRLHESILRALHGEEASLLQEILKRSGRHFDSPSRDQPVRLDKQLLPKVTDDVIIPVLVMACNRETVNRALDQLFKYRPKPEHRFPIMVSQDCGHPGTANVIGNYGNRLEHWRQPDLSGYNLPPREKRFEGYYKISRHYKWALDNAFLQRNFTAVIIVEDDLDISPDFFEYFAATLPVLQRDPSLWCVSAWNDNGKGNLVSDEPELLYRTDFFPGLGWMLLRSTWLEIRTNWPRTFWDEYMRRPDVRRNRACVRPEISRTVTFGRKGVSNGQFFDKHLRFIRLNNRFVPFTHQDVSYLEKVEFDPLWQRRVYGEARKVSLGEVTAGRTNGASAVRIEYTSQPEFVAMTRQLGAMEDVKAGVPRAAYMGVVTVVHKGVRVFVAPALPWGGYNPNWK